MSRIGKMPVQIPQGVTVLMASQVLSVEGPGGKLSQTIHPDVEIRVENNLGIVTRRNELKKTRAMHGLYRKLFDNMVVGVTKGYQKALLINGVGYRAEIQGNNLVLSLGFSNPVEYPIPEGIKIACESQSKVIVSGINKERVGQVAAEIRSIRPPEPYKGKGIKYETETIRRKVGKTGVK
ncbi:MAG: 50S ribosomal protein L6 [Spirochaetales bacterium]|jgi:large subunit ribosomal protein L6|nr:50S ribosomal protein L6 [Spirochaetales bacterium]